jgi:hypothetical protein
MPLIRFDLLKGRSDVELQAMLEAAHEAVVESFGVPARDRYQIVTEHEPGRMVLQDTGLGFERSDRMILVQVFTSPRKSEMKEKFFKLLVDKLGKQCGISAHDIMVTCSENTKADWSFGFGRAQFLTGEL